MIKGIVELVFTPRVGLLLVLLAYGVLLGILLY